MRYSPFPKKIKRLLSVCLCLTMLLVLFMPVSVSAAESQVRTVRVGFFAFDGYHEMDESGRMSGYGYDFLTLMKRYANVQYEYVGYEKSWDAMLEMLRSGEIDMVTSAHKTEDRLEEFDFSVPIGENCVQLKCRADDDRYTAGLFDTYNGMTIGLVQGSSVNEKMEEFAQANGFSYTASYYTDSTQLKEALDSGKIDAVAASSLRKGTGEKVLSEFDTEYFYAMVRKGDTELLNLINDAVSQMDVSEGDWKHTLYYNNYTAVNYTDLVFTQEEKDYIAAHSAGGDKVIVAADNAWAPFVSKENGIYVGIIPDYIDRIMEMTGMEYEYWDPGEDIVDEDILLTGEADLYLGFVYDAYLSEQCGFVESPPFMNTEACYLKRKDSAEIKTLALSNVNPRLNAYLSPEDDQKIVYYTNAAEAVEAVKNGKADAAFLYSAEGEYYMNQDTTGTLVFETVPEVTFQICAIASQRENRVLMGILSKCINAFSDTEMEEIISENLTSDVHSLTIWEYAEMHPAAAALVLCVILAVCLSAIAMLITRKTERKYLAELKQARDMAQEANLAKTRFLFNMSHDIRTPMNAILGYAELMEKHKGDREKFEDYLKKIRSSGDFLLELINNVLEMARIESGSMTLDETVWDAYEMNDSIFAVLEAQMKAKGISYTRSIDVKNRYAYIDSLKLREIHLNLLSNAYKYTPAGGSVSMELKELPSEREGYVLYQTTVSDTGIGMSEEYLPHIFEEFSREKSATENKIQGTGLGMPIVKKLVDLMGGSITVTSKLGDGTTFVLLLYHRVADESALKIPEAPEAETADFSNKRILLAEDNDLNAEIATEILEETGVRVERAADGIICIDMLVKAEAGYYDLIFMDIQMPNLDGYGAAKRIRALGDEKKANIPIIAMTANAFAEDRENALAAGMNDHMAKPINMEELIKILGCYLK